MKTRFRFIDAGSDEEVEEVFRLRYLYGLTPSKIARKLRISKERTRELMIAATYWGKGYRDGRNVSND